MQAKTPPNINIKKLYILQEIDVLNLLLTSGLRGLQEDKLYNRKTFTFLILIASGLERLMKIVIYLNRLEKTKKAMSKNDFKNLGHDLVKLKEEIVSNCFSQDYLKKPFAQEDLKFLESDEGFNEMLSLISDFASSGRYAYLDSLANPTKAPPSPEVQWEELGRKLHPPDYAVYMVGDNQQKSAKAINRHFIILLEKAIRAMNRLFVHGALGTTGKGLITNTGNIWLMKDEELGTKNYD